GLLPVPGGEAHPRRRTLAVEEQGRARTTSGQLVHREAAAPAGRPRHRPLAPARGAPAPARGPGGDVDLAADGGDRLQRAHGTDATAGDLGAEEGGGALGWRRPAGADGA